MTHPAQYDSRHRRRNLRRNAHRSQTVHSGGSGGGGARRARFETLEGRTLFALAIDPYFIAGDPDTLANAIVTPNTGITVVGSTYDGVDQQSGFYTDFNFASGSTRLVAGDGVILTNGLANAALGPNSNNPDQLNSFDDASNQLGSAGDGDLDSLLTAEAGFPIDTFDAAALTITFTTAPGTNSILFDFVFASEEFPEFVGSPFNDTFAAFIDGQQVSFDADGNLITVNNNFFQLNNSGVNPTTGGGGVNQDPRVNGTTGVSFNIEYDGLTPLIRTQAPIDPNLTSHTIKFVIADATDERLDSGVFISRLQGSGQSVSVPVTDLPKPGVFTITAAPLSVNETASSVLVTVTREGGASGLVTVDIFSQDRTATGGSDYTALALTTLTFVDQQTSQEVMIPILDDPFAEGDEAFIVALTNATGGAVVGDVTDTTITILDNEVGVQFSEQFYQLQEGTDTVTAVITLQLTKAASGPVTVDFSTVAGGSATPDFDFTPVSQTVTFQPGQTTTTVEVPVLDDYVVEDVPETINLRLSNPSAPYILGLNNPATIVVSDLHRPPAVLDAQFVTNERFLNGVALRFSTAMQEPNAEDLTNYDLYVRKESKRLGGSPTRTRMEIASAVYDANSRTVTLTSVKPLRDNKVYEVVANTTRIGGVESVDGEKVDGNYDNFGGDDFTGYLVRTKATNYFDRDGDRVTMQLKGPGKFELFRNVEREARLVRMLDTTLDTIFTGSFDAVDISDDRARVRTILGTPNGFRNRLPQPPFQVRQVINADSIPNT
jgi:hypothetical protein